MQFTVYEDIGQSTDQVAASIAKKGKKKKKKKKPYQQQMDTEENNLTETANNNAEGMASGSKLPQIRDDPQDLVPKKKNNLFQDINISDEDNSDYRGNGLL